MKLILTVLFGLFLASPNFVSAQDVEQTPMLDKTKKSVRKSPLTQATKTIGEDLILDLQYGSPSVKGRKIWGDLVPFDAVWRTGANEATTFEISHDAMVEGQLLKAGRYSLFTIPTNGEWTLIFNKVADQWGAYNYNEAEDALRVTISPQTREELAERLFIDIDDNGKVSIVWEHLEIAFQVKKA